MAISTTPDRVPASGTRPTAVTAPPLDLPHVGWRAWAPIAVTLALALQPPPDGLAQHAWYFFAIFAGVIVGLMLEPLPGGAIGRIGMTVVSDWRRGCSTRPPNSRSPASRRPTRRSTGRCPGSPTARCG